MNILKAFGLTLGFALIIELVALWALMDVLFNSVADYYLLINGTLELLVVFLLVYLFGGKKLLQRIYFPFKSSIIAIAIGLGFVFIQSPLNAVYETLFNHSFNIDYCVNLSRVLDLKSSLSIIVLLPVAEELFFRIIIQKKLLKEYGSFISIMFSSLLFSIIHFQLAAFYFEVYEFNPHGAFIAFFGGLISASLFQYSKTITTPILMHIFWNLGVVLFTN